MELGWLREDLTELKVDVKDIRVSMAGHGERLAAIEERLEAVRSGRTERAGIWAAFVTAVGALATAAFK